MTPPARPFVTRIHLEPGKAREDIANPDWAVVAHILQTLGLGPARRLELYADDAIVMTVEANGDAFHISIQAGEVYYYCLRDTEDTSGKVEGFGPFAFNAAEICRSRTTMVDVVRAFWAGGKRTDTAWNAYDVGERHLSPMNNTTAKASAEVGAMIQAFQAGKRGGDATMRVRGTWNASPATRADMKVVARWLELTKLTVTDADGTVRTFEGDELLPVAHGGKAWFDG